MGLHLPPKSTLLGQSVSVIQKVVRKNGWLDRCDPTQDMRWFVMMNDDPALEALVKAGGAELAPKVLRRGEEKLFVLTDLGSALMAARLRKRTPIKKADPAFAELQAGVERLNETGLVEVPEVWLLGSYMRREAEIGDIDAVILTDWVAPNFDSLTKGVAEKFAGEPWLERAMRNLYGAGRTPAEEMTHRLIFGGRRKPIFDGVQITSFKWHRESSNLNVGMPVQRVYTRAGGWVPEEPLARHPSAKEAMSRPHKVLRIDQGEFTSCNDASSPVALPSVRERCAA